RSSDLPRCVDEARPSGSIDRGFECLPSRLARSPRCNAAASTSRSRSARAATGSVRPRSRGRWALFPQTSSSASSKQRGSRATEASLFPTEFRPPIDLPRNWAPFLAHTCPQALGLPQVGDAGIPLLQYGAVVVPALLEQDLSVEVVGQHLLHGAVQGVAVTPATSGVEMQLVPRIQSEHALRGNDFRASVGILDHRLPGS